MTSNDPKSTGAGKVAISDAGTLSVKDMIFKLFDAGLLKFGSFKLKSGFQSPVYVDLRGLVSQPELMSQVAGVIAHGCQTLLSESDIICGIPYTALPLATLVSVQLCQPMVVVRPERKDYGTKKQVEGYWLSGQKCLLVDDVCSSGGSLLEVAAVLRNSVAVSEDVGGPLKVTDALVLVDRETGGREALEAGGVKLHSIITLSQICDILVKNNRVSQQMADQVHAFIAETHASSMKCVQTGTIPAIVVESSSNMKNYRQMQLAERSALPCHPAAKRLFDIMQQKQTNLCVAADLDDKDAVLALANHIGPHICAFKIHCDIIWNFNENFIAELKYFAEKHNFLLMEDRKFVDIGATVATQLEAGLFRISSWADLITVSLLPGPGILDAIRDARTNPLLGVILLAEMSSAGNLCQHTHQAVEWSKTYADLVCGFVCQSPIETAGAGFLRMTPGVRADDKTGDGLSQQYNHPDVVVGKNGADIIIVGRGITEAKPKDDKQTISEAQASVAEFYQRLGWKALETRLAAKQ